MADAPNNTTTDGAAETTPSQSLPPLRRSITPIGFFFGQSAAAQSGNADNVRALAYPKRQPRKPWKTSAARLVAATLVSLASGVIWFWLNVPALSAGDMGFWVMLFWMCLVFALVQVFLQGSANKPARNPFVHLFANAKAAVIAMTAVVVVMVAGSIPALASGTASVPQGAAGASTVTVNATDALLLARQALEEDTELADAYDIIPIESLDAGENGPRWVFALGQPDAMPSPASLHQTSPAYVAVDAETGDASVIAYDEPMRYSPSNILLGNVQRHLRATYPCMMFGNIHLEFSENGAPCWVVTTAEHTVGLFGGSHETGTLVVDGVTGACQQRNA